MSDVLSRYRAVDYRLPETNGRWALYGSGLQNLGKEGRPVRVPMPEISDDEILARVDAVGLCFSDVKLITQGNQHPRISGRDLQNDPTVPGHEASLTVVKVGKNRQKDFKVGERYLIQADVFYKGASMAFGYVIPGALQQFTVITKEILDGDEGCYLLPVRDIDGYAEVALSEPWACVVAAYRITHRENLQPRGTALFVGGADARFDEYDLEGAISNEGWPKRIVVVGIGGALATKLGEEAQRRGVELIRVDVAPGGASLTDLVELGQRYTDGQGFDDVVFFGTPAGDAVEQAGKALGKGGILAILAEKPVDRKVQIDVGRVHYDGHRYLGSRSTRLADAYRMSRTMDLKPNGSTWIMGAGGPMGQMHAQRAAGAPSGPATIVATDIDNVRLGEVESRFVHLASARGARLVTINPKELDAASFDDRLRKETGGRLFDDVIVMAPVPALIEQGSEWLAEGGVMNIFAGVPRGTIATLDISGCYLHGHRWVGSSGSLISDLQFTLEQTQKGHLSPNHSIAAIGGLNAAGEGLKSVKEGRFPGKIVIWPQIEDLPLLALSDLGRTLPNVAAKLTPQGMWTKEAEEELLRSQLKL